MALNLNNYAKRNVMLNALYTRVFNSTNRIIRVFPDTVPFPSTAPTGADGLPGGHILAFDLNTFTVSVVGNALVTTAGLLTANATAAGTLSWFASVNNIGPGDGPMFISNAVSTSGNGGILIVSTLTPGNGDPVTISLNLTAV
jgi:hypothetical protein